MSKILLGSLAGVQFEFIDGQLCGFSIGGHNISTMTLRELSEALRRPAAPIRNIEKKRESLKEHGLPAAQYESAEQELAVGARRILVLQQSDKDQDERRYLNDI